MAEVDVLDDVVEFAGNELLVDDDVFFINIGCFIGYVFEDLFQNRVQPAGADVFRFPVDAVGVFGNGIDAVVGKFQSQAFRFEEGCILFDQGLARFGQDAAEVFDGQRLEFDADRETALEFRNEVARLRYVEGAGSDKEDVVGLDRPVFRIDRSPFDDRQDVALDPFAGYVGTVGAAFFSNLIEFVDEDDARFFRSSPQPCLRWYPCRGIFRVLLL